ncbi:MAG: hypothetical protein ACYDC7_12215 [Acidithiobacillus ferrivorans]|uniref:hypothetical protein n=1 Tax=Acidithiobacillus ferrivorans TaxID=160808 RepID=UPI0003175D55|nr:hypothetical protein [Acidithiobacillus ferrivorans]
MALESPNAALPDQGFEVLAIAPVMDVIHAGNMNIKTNIVRFPYLLWNGIWDVFGNRIYSPVHYGWDILIHKNRRDMDYVYPIISKMLYIKSTGLINATAAEYR